MKLNGKKSVAAICVATAMMVTGCSATSTSTTTSVFSKPGTYTSVQNGFAGEVEFSATFTADAIESIEVVNSSETENRGGVAMDQLIQEMVDTQSIGVDTVSGATLSSNALISAMEDMVGQAGGDVEALSEKVEKESEEVAYETKADLIVVGGGAAGMTAAITAADKGVSVILIEKSSTLGGNTICAANGINAADATIQLENEDYKAANGSVEGLEELQSNNHDAKEELVDAFAENSGETIDWLSSLGATFTVDIQNDERNQSQNAYMLKATEDGSTAVTLINAVEKELENKDVTVYYNMDAYELVTDETGTVTGVIAKDANGTDVTFEGTAVLLATGGFGQNSELVAEVNPSLTGAVTDEIAPTTGEGLEMAQAIGADAVNLDAIQTFPSVIPGYGMVLPMNLPGGFTPDALYVNSDAERFTAEAFEIPDVILAQKDGVVYCIFDDSGMNDFLQGLVDNGIISSGETAQELAEKLELDPTALENTITSFNEDIEDGVDDAQGRAQNLNAMEGTLYGYRFGVGAHYFMGGLSINEDTQVLNTNGEAINGLYAAGEVTGGFHGTFRVDGSGLGDSFTFGRIAGNVIADSLSK